MTEPNELTPREELLPHATPEGNLRDNKYLSQGGRDPDGTPSTSPRRTVLREESKLLPCPFCGSTTIQVCGETLIYVSCFACHGESGQYEDDTAAISHWNRRAYLAATALPAAAGDYEDLLSDARGIVEALLEECRGSTHQLTERIEDGEQWLAASREQRDNAVAPVSLPPEMEIPHAPECDSLRKFTHSEPCPFWTKNYCFMEPCIHGIPMKDHCDKCGPQTGLRLPKGWIPCGPAPCGNCFRAALLDTIRTLQATSERAMNLTDLAQNRADDYLADLSRLRAENEGLRAETRLIISNLAAALFPNSPQNSAEAEFDIDAMGACQVIRRMRSENEELLKDKERLDWLERVSKHPVYHFSLTGAFTEATQLHVDSLRDSLDLGMDSEAVDASAALNAGEAPRE